MKAFRTLFKMFFLDQLSTGTIVKQPS